MRDALRGRNENLQRELNELVRLVSTVSVVPELDPYRAVFLSSVRGLLTKANRNLHLLGLGLDSLLPDVLSETSNLIQWARLFKFRYIRALYRTCDWDRICLRTITWLHNEHSQTKQYPAVFADDDVSIIPSTKLVPLYFFPCLEQRGLRFQPLLFHEFGHQLYQCHKQEMDDLVGEFQQSVEAELLPASQRNDRFAEEQAKNRQSVVETWYKWTQEFFCDAVGLVIGGPCFLEAFAEYISRLRQSDFYRQPSDLHGSTHPVSWLRVQFLADRGHLNGFEEPAERVVRHWRETAAALGIWEDYHGFYTSALKPILMRTLDDMLTEAAPRQCSTSEAAGDGWDSSSLNLVALINQVWLRYLQDPSGYHQWESGIIKDVYDLKGQFGKNPLS